MAIIIFHPTHVVFLSLSSLFSFRIHGDDDGKANVPRRLRNVLVINLITFREPFP